MVRRYALAALFACAFALAFVVAPFLSPSYAAADQLDRAQLGQMVDAWASLQPAPVKVAAKAAVQPVAAAVQSEPLRLIVETAPAPAPAPVVAPPPSSSMVDFTNFVQHDLIPALLWAASAVLAWTCRSGPAWLVFIIKAYGEQRILAWLHDMAANRIAGATKGNPAPYQADVGSAVLATGIKLALEYYPVVVKLMGGEAALQAKFLGWLHLDPSVTAEQMLPAPAAPASAAA